MWWIHSACELNPPVDDGLTKSSRNFFFFFREGETKYKLLLLLLLWKVVFPERYLFWFISFFWLFPICGIDYEEILSLPPEGETSHRPQASWIIGQYLWCCCCWPSLHLPQCRHRSSCRWKTIMSDIFSTSMPIQTVSSSDAPAVFLWISFDYSPNLNVINPIWSRREFTLSDGSLEKGKTKKGIFESGAKWHLPTKYRSWRGNGQSAVIVREFKTSTWGAINNVQQRHNVPILRCTIY